MISLRSLTQHIETFEDNTGMVYAWHQIYNAIYINNETVRKSLITLQYFANNTIEDRVVSEFLAQLSHNIDEIFLSKQGVLSYYMPRVGQMNKVVTVHPVDQLHSTKIGPFETSSYNTYNPELNGSINVELSCNKLCPDYTLGGLQYFLPAQFNGGQITIVEIEITGIRASDDSNARSKIGITKRQQDDLVKHTWHHMDDFTIK